MQLDEALRQISDIRLQMARHEVFRGYRSISVGFSGVAALLAASIQPLVIPSPQNQLGQYLGLWVGVAAVSLIAGGIHVYWRMRQSGSEWERQQTLLAVEHFLPAVVVGGLLTLCIYRSAPGVAWLLPGLWSLTYGLGVFASWRLLPRQVLWVGLYYTTCGCACVLWGGGDHAFSPWQMGISFGGGQLLGSAILYWTLEHNNDHAQSE